MSRHSADADGASDKHQDKHQIVRTIRMEPHAFMNAIKKDLGLT
jgi:hypothetical protein